MSKLVLAVLKQKSKSMVLLPPEWDQFLFFGIQQLLSLSKEIGDSKGM
jgi:hypothetical protein